MKKNSFYVRGEKFVWLVVFLLWAAILCLAPSRESCVVPGGIVSQDIARETCSRSVETSDAF